MLNTSFGSAEGRSVAEARESYLRPRLLVDLTTSVHLLGGAPVGLTRVETRLASALLDAEHLNPCAVIMAEDGSIRALDMSTARKVLTLWQDQIEVPIRLRQRKGAAKVQKPQAHSAGKAQGSGRTFADQRPLAQMYSETGILLRQAGKVLTGRLRLAELSDSFLVRHGFTARNPVIAPKGKAPQVAVAQDANPLGTARQKIVREAQLIVNPTSSDFLWTAGLYSHCIRPRMLLELKSRCSLRIGCLIYDVIRVLYRDHNPKDINGDVYLANTLDLMEGADMLLAISHWTRKTSIEIAQAEGRNHQPIDVLALGVDLPAAALGSQAEARLRDAITQRPFALAVGSVEPRKNIRHLLDVWDLLAKSGTPPLDLVIVGRQGHGAEDEARHLMSHALFDTHIFWLDSCPDRALMSLYKSSTVVLCPSLAEGWGLLLGEALLIGKPVIASDTSAHPEAGFGQALLLGATDSPAWADAIRQVAAAPDDFLPDPSHFTPPTWDQAGKTLISLIEAHFSATPKEDRSHAHPSD